VKQKNTESTPAVISLSWTSKMPGASWGIPAKFCKVGSLLRKVKGSVCAKCYARKGRYVFPNVQQAQAKRLKTWQEDRKAWVKAMIERLSENDVRKSGQFRWFDSGDLQGVDMLHDIVEIATATPWLEHRLPTKEVGAVTSFFQNGGELPANLTVRISAGMVDGTAPDVFGLPTARVVTKNANCPAPEQGGKCLDCRMCFDKAIKEVRYGLH
jgi:hypothetical protein